MRFLGDGEEEEGIVRFKVAQVVGLPRFYWQLIDADKEAGAETGAGLVFSSSLNKCTS